MTPFLVRRPVYDKSFVKAIDKGFVPNVDFSAAALGERQASYTDPANRPPLG